MSLVAIVSHLKSTVPNCSEFYELGTQETHDLFTYVYKRTPSECDLWNSTKQITSCKEKKTASFSVPLHDCTDKYITVENKEMKLALFLHHTMKTQREYPFWDTRIWTWWKIFEVGRRHIKLGTEGIGLFLSQGSL